MVCQASRGVDWRVRANGQREVKGKGDSSGRLWTSALGFRQRSQGTLETPTPLIESIEEPAGTTVRLGVY